MTKRTSKMMRIPGALVPAIRELTLAWHWRERQAGRGRGPTVADALAPGAALDDIAAVADSAVPEDVRTAVLETLRRRQLETVERLREELEAAESELADTELKLNGL